MRRLRCLGMFLSRPSPRRLMRFPWLRIPFCGLNFNRQASCRHRGQAARCRSGGRASTGSRGAGVAVEWVGRVHGRSRTGAAARGASEWLPQQRWFGAKTRKIQSVRVVDWVELSEAQAPDGTAKGTDIRGQVAIRLALFFVEITYSAGPTDTYSVPLAVSNSFDADQQRVNFPLAFSPRLQHIWRICSI